MTTNGFDLSLSALNQYLATSAGRDRFGKFVHYFFRGVAGIANDIAIAQGADSAIGSTALFVHEKSRSLFVRVMESRRTLRWLSSVSIIVMLRSGNYPWGNRPAFILAQLGMMFWQIVDHIRWLQQINWLSGDQLVSKRISFSGFVFSSLISSIHYWHELQSPEVSNDHEKRKTTRLNLIKSFVTLISTLHVSELFMTHEGICGACGAIASAIDIYQTYPRIAKKKAE